MPEKEIKEVRESPGLYIVEYTDGTKEYMAFGKRFTDEESAVRYWQEQHTAAYGCNAEMRAGNVKAHLAIGISSF